MIDMLKKKKIKRIRLRKEAYRRLIRRVLDRDGWRCQICGSLENLHVHHKTPRSQQGNDALDNLVTLCARCHVGKHGQLAYSSTAFNHCANLRGREREPAAILVID